ncbi:unnamed protein product, partial [Echinostoma caproni]|uniref:MAST3 n=1 Tax=Echinostoma caproni TaxID=27848 RepID=A0A183BDA8_9TREM
KRNLGSRVGKSFTISRIRVSNSPSDEDDDEDDEDDLISDDEDNLKLWSISSQESNHSTPGQIERGPLRLAGISQSGQEFRKSCASLNDSELTIRGIGFN